MNKIFTNTVAQCKLKAKISEQYTIKGSVDEKKKEVQFKFPGCYNVFYLVFCFQFRLILLY